MRSHRREPPPLDQRLVHETELAVTQVADSAVRHPRGLGRRSRREVAPFDQADLEPSAGGVERDSRPGDAAAHDDHVESTRTRAAPSCARAFGARTPLRLRLGPVVADADVHRERRIERIRAAHLLAHERRAPWTTSASGTSSSSSSCTCSTSRAPRPSARSRSWMRTIATLMMSAFEPCITKLTASRSPSERVCRLDARISGTGRRRPSSDVT